MTGEEEKGEKTSGQRPSEAAPDRRHFLGADDVAFLQMPSAVHHKSHQTVAVCIRDMKNTQPQPPIR